MSIKDQKGKLLWQKECCVPQILFHFPPGSWEDYLPQLPSLSLVS